jgi:hypothetical protein
MPPKPPADGRVRPAAVVQADIRALLLATGGWLWGPSREQYQALRDEWVAAMRAEVVEAA